MSGILRKVLATLSELDKLKPKLNMLAKKLSITEKRTPKKKRKRASKK